MDNIPHSSSVVDDWVTWLGSIGFICLNRLDLTWDDKEHPAPTTSTSALWWLSRLIAVMNERVWGSHYTRQFGHSYFSYIIGIEWQRRGTIHLHVAVNEPVPYTVVHSWWQQWCGFAYVKQAGEHGIRYALKYALKTGSIDAEKQVHLRSRGLNGKIVTLDNSQRRHVLMLAKQWSAIHARKKLERSSRDGGQSQG